MSSSAVAGGLSTQSAVGLDTPEALGPSWSQLCNPVIMARHPFVAKRHQASQQDIYGHGSGPHESGLREAGPRVSLLLHYLPHEPHGKAHGMALPACRLYQTWQQACTQTHARLLQT